jgi:hypothetical protein
MHRLNLTIDEGLYEKARAFSFLENKSISQMIRESLSDYLNKSREKSNQAQLLLDADDDEEEILLIIKNEDFTSQDDFTKKFSTYPKNLQSKIFKAIGNIPIGDIKRMIGLFALKSVTKVKKSIKNLCTIKPLFA